MKPVARFCELCNAQAALYCPSDSAFLCWSCDAKVHQANFLVARHVRRIICSECTGFTQNPASALCFPQSLSNICAPCSPATSYDDHLHSLSSASNSDCVSSTLSCATSQKKTDSDRCKISKFRCSKYLKDLSAAGGGEVTPSQRRSRRGASIMDLKAEGVLVYWCEKLGLAGDRTVRLGRNALNLCWEQMAGLPFRVSLTACLWFGLRFCGDRSLGTWQVLKRLEGISGVQAKLISAAASRLERVLKVVATRKQGRQRNHHLEEGWAESECSA